MADIFSAIRKPLANLFAGVYAAINAKFDTLDEDLETTVETALGAALPAALETAVPAVVEEAVPDAVAAIIKKGGITLNGLAYTPVLFGDDSAAILESTVTGPFDISGVGDGGTLILAVDGGEAQTATINYTQGKSVSGASPSTDISGESDSKFKISVDGDTAEEVTLTVGSLNSGALIAAAMQTGIRALGGKKALVTVTYDDVEAGKYCIVSADGGTGSAVVITAAENGSITEELKIGTVAGGTETAGTGDCVSAKAVIAAEIAAVCTTDITGATVTDNDGKILITSDTEGVDSSIVAGNSTLKTVLGIAQNAAGYGAQGLGLDDAEDGNYVVNATLKNVTSLAGKCLSVANRTATGFRVYCETTAATDDVDLIIM
jgi:hypothetical protein